jgi:hypothetical protein
MDHFFQLSLILAIIVLLLVGPIVWQLRTNIGPLERLQALGDQALAAVNIAANEERLSICGKDVSIVAKEEEIVWSGYRITILKYSCTYFVRSAHGEYFMLIYRYGAREYVKHISHDVARVKLREKYVPPAT